MFSARSRIRTGCPMSSTNNSPLCAIAPLANTSWLASGIVMKYRMMRLFVSVTGPPFAICLLNSGITEPAEPRTFPNRVALYLTFPCVLALCTSISHIRFVAPITFVGLTALSVDTIMKRSVPYSSQQSITFFVPKTLFCTASTQLCSISGTCLCAAALITI